MQSVWLPEGSGRQTQKADRSPRTRINTNTHLKHTAAPFDGY